MAIVFELGTAFPDLSDESELQKKKGQSLKNIIAYFIVVLFVVLFVAAVLFSTIVVNHIQHGL